MGRCRGPSLLGRGRPVGVPQHWVEGAGEVVGLGAAVVLFGGGQQAGQQQQQQQQQLESLWSSLRGLLRGARTWLLTVGLAGLGLELQAYQSGLILRGHVCPFILL